jgi:hypothetical protein
MVAALMTFIALTADSWPSPLASTAQTAASASPKESLPGAPAKEAAARPTTKPTAITTANAVFVTTTGIAAAENMNERFMNIIAPVKPCLCLWPMWWPNHPDFTPKQNRAETLDARRSNTHLAKESNRLF